MSRPVLDQPIEQIAYSPAQAASACGLGLTTLRELIASGQIAHFRVSRRILIRKADLAEFCDRLFREQHGGRNKPTSLPPCSDAQGGGHGQTR